MSEYTPFVSAALEMINKFGQVVTITTRSPGAYNISTSSVTVTESSATAKGVTTNYSNSEIDGELIQRGDLRLLLAASGLTRPTIGDKVTIATITYTIKNVDEVSPGGEPILHKAQLRK